MVTEELCHTQKTQRITKKNSMRKKNREEDRRAKRENEIERKISS